MWAEAAGAGQPRPAGAGDCGAEPGPEPGGGCADMGGQVTRNLLYGKERPRQAAGKGAAGDAGDADSARLCSRSIPLQERGWPGRKAGLGWDSSG